MTRVFTLLLLGLLATNTFARIIPNKDPVNGVLDAQLVVIAWHPRADNSTLFTIQEVVLGDVKRGDTLDLGDFSLSTVEESGPSVVDPITFNTRILLFLQRVKGSATLWEPTYFKQSFFWVQRPEDAPLLRRAAERAMELRRQWESAASISDPRLRVAALWPFLSSYGVSFSQHTQAELKKTAPVSGQYLAEHFDAMPNLQREMLLSDAPAYGSDQLHQRLKKFLSEQQHAYEEYVAGLGHLPKEVDWNTMPADRREGLSALCYGLVGLAKYRDRGDLPFIRALAFWSVKYHNEQIAAAAVDAFRDMPDKANLLAIESILREFLPGRSPGIWSVDGEAERALCQHKYPETVPLLAPFAQEAALGSEAEVCLTEIVGLDLGKNPKAWMDWYAAAKKAPVEPSPSPN